MSKNMCNGLSHNIKTTNKHLLISQGKLFPLPIQLFQPGNGFLFAAQRFIYKMEIVSLHLAAGRINKDFLKKLIESIVYEEDYSESLKMELLECISREI